MEPSGNKRYDVIVIGAGPGGYPCAIRLGQLGLSVLCVEKEKPGGVCLNWGCIPSKALIHAASQFEEISRAATKGITVGEIGVDAGQLQDWKDGIVARLNKGVRGLLKANGADYLQGSATMSSARTVVVSKADGQNERFEASKAVVVATGARSIELPALPFDGEQIISAKEAVSLRAIPRRLAVVGGGVIGLELGTVYQKLGSELHVVEALPQLLAGHDAECVRLVERKIRKRGGKMYKKALATGTERNTDGSLTLNVDQDGKAIQITADTVLVAVGMRPSTAGLGLEELGVELDDKGFIATDDRCQSNVEGIYAIGDVSGPPLLAHKATKEGELVAEVIAGQDVSKHWKAMPGATFTDPEIAGVGLTAQSAEDKGLSIKIGKFPFAALGKALAMDHAEGFVKVIADADSGRVLGVHIVGPEASTMISEAVLSLELGATVEQVMSAVHPHPTLSEAYMEAAANVLKQAIHIQNR